MALPFPYYYDNNEVYNNPPAALPAVRHPFSRPNTGPVGSYHYRAYNGGLLIRVDVPGVENFPVPNPNQPIPIPPDNDPISILTRSNLVHFRAISHVHLRQSTHRAYEGFIRVSREVGEDEIETTVSNGVLRMFIPNASGTLHFYHVPGPVYLSTVVSYEPQDEGMHDCQPVIGYFQSPEERPPVVAEAFGGLVPYETVGWAEVYPQRLMGSMGVSSLEMMRRGERDFLVVRFDAPGARNEDQRELQVNGASVVARTWSNAAAHVAEDRGRAYSVVVTASCGCCNFEGANMHVINGLVIITVRYVQE